LHDITTVLLFEVCHNVATFTTIVWRAVSRSANVEDGAYLDVSTESFWGWDRRMTYFGIKVKVFNNPFASTHISSPPAQCYHHKHWLSAIAELNIARRICMINVCVKLFG